MYTDLLEAEVARLEQLEVDNLSANVAQANSLQAKEVNTGSKDLYVTSGFPLDLFTADTKGHYNVTASSADGSYATATLVVSGGVVKVVPVSSEGITITAFGSTVQLLADNKLVEASWLKTR